MNKFGKISRLLTFVAAWLFLASHGGLFAAQPQPSPPLTNFDVRLPAPASPPGYNAALAHLRDDIPDARIHLDKITGSPAWITSPRGFLTGANGVGRAIPPATLSQFSANDSNRVIRAFLQEHRGLFGCGPEALNAARVKCEVVNARNGLRTTVWEQQLDGIGIFDALFISHISAHGELVSLSSHFVPAPALAADVGTPNRALLETTPLITATQAVINSVRNIGETLQPRELVPSKPESSPEKHQTFQAAILKGDAGIRLVWLPMNRNSLRLCWEVILMSRARGQMFLVLIDAQTGAPLLRHCLTEDISNASYRVFTSSSPTPFLSPSNSLPTIMGYSSPQTNQPPQICRVLVVTNALDTNASPDGWINDGDNQTYGNNVQAPPNPPRPTGSPFRVFNFPLNLNNDPVTYSNASVVNLFYWCNWMHDRLYDLGFTEAAGNFQTTNFGRGGLGNDPVEAYAQDGDGINNGSFSSPPDGTPGVMQIYLFTGPAPERDGDFDTQLILHEYTHGLSSRLVGGGVGFTELQSLGLSEGWSDFYSLALTSQSTDDPNACYPEGPYTAYQYNGLTQNYYFGIRRYPYSTSLTNCPGTFADIDPGQASSHSGVPLNPAIADTATEIHNMGEIWCDALWDARANLIGEYGFATGNQLILQLVTDAMSLTPANPTYTDARDAIIQADLVDTGGENYQALWLAFAKRGLGYGATAPDSSTTSGVLESYVVPDDLLILPAADFSSTGADGGPFNPSYNLYALKNTGTNVLNWAAGVNISWVDLSATNGTLSNLLSATNISVSLNAVADTLSAGNYCGLVYFTNLTSGFVQTGKISLNITLPEIYSFPLNTDPGWARQGEWAFGQPAGQGGASYGYPDPTSGFTGSNVFGVNLDGDYSTTPGGPYYLTAGPLNFAGVQNVGLQFERWLNSDAPPYAYDDVSVSSDGTNWTTVFDNSAGVITDSAWTNCSYSLSPYADNQPSVYVRWGYQITDGAFPYSGWNIDDIAFLGSPQLYVSLPVSATEGVGLLAGQGQVAILVPLQSDTSVKLVSGDANTVVVPSFVTIPAGQTNAVFDLTIQDDGLLDGTRPVQVTASALGCATGTNSILIFDAETAVLGVNIETNAMEGDGYTSGQVTISAAPAADISVCLSSSDPALLMVPVTVIIPEGQTSADFNATVENPGRINGDETVAVTAHVQNWTDGVADIDIQYFQYTNLSLTIPTQARESNGLLTNAGTVGISGILSTNLVVSLVSSNTAKLLVPSSVTILAGQTSAVFNLTTVAGNPPSAPVSVAVSASAPGFSLAAADINIIDNQTPPAPFAPAPPNFSTNNPINVSLSWRPGLGEGVETVVNGGFETGDFTGWTVSTNVVINNGSVYPPSGDVATTPFDGNFSALAEPSPPASALLCQDISLPTNSGTITLSWADRIRNFYTDFETNQQFLVQIQDTNNNALATVFCTRSNDCLLNDWTQRSADISAFAGQTIRLAFLVQADLGYLDVHLDDISARCANLPPVTYSVYFGTDAVPGPGDYLGATTNTSWTLPLLTPLTNYYWQIVASRSNQTAGPIWQFSALPTLFITNLYLSDNTNGVTNAVFNVALMDASTNPITVDFATSDGTAIAGLDYSPTNGTLTFNPGDTNQTITVPVFFNTNLPALKTFTVNLSNPVNAALGDNAGTVTINETSPLAPVVAPVSNQTVHAQITLSFIATATNLNDDPMLFSLDPGAPAAAVIGPTNGLFTWTTADADVGSHSITIRATDTSNTLSGAATFSVTVVPRPTISSIHISGGQVSLGWSAIPGDSYQLQSNTNLTGVWTNVPGVTSATNSIATKIDFSGLVISRFYRVVVLP